MATTITVTPVDVGTTPGDNTGDSARVAFQAVNANEANFKAGIEAIREPLTANRTYYVRTDGSDSTNDGLTNSAGGAFLTIQKAVDVVCDTLDARGYAVTIQVGAGTYSAGVGLRTAVGFKQTDDFLIKGDTTTPSNCVISVTSGQCFFGYYGGCNLKIEGFKLTNSNGSLVSLGDNDNLNIGAMEYGATPNGAHLETYGTGSIYCNAAYTISGGGWYHLLASQNGSIRYPYSGFTVTVTGTPAFSGQFAYVDDEGYLVAGNVTWSGAATCQRYLVTGSGHLQMYNMTNQFPGNSAGGILGNGTYNYTQTAHREPLTANRTYYVRTDGVDTNTGLVNSAGGAFLTIQAALDAAALLDNMGLYLITIQVGDGTYTDGVVIPYVRPTSDNSWGLLLKGNTTTPASCIISTAGDAILAYSPCVVKVEGFKLVSSANSGLVLGNGCFMTMGVMEFGACSYTQIGVYEGGHLFVRGNYTISGGAAYHIDCESLSEVASSYGSPITITLTGTPAFSGVFAVAYDLALIQDNNTYSGSATGKRYESGNNAMINTFSGGADHFPGDSAGSNAVGGEYA